MAKKANKKVEIKTETHIPKKEFKSRKKFIFIGGIVVLALILLSFFIFSGKTAESGDVVYADYTGYFDDGTVFDTSIKLIGEQAALQKNVYSPLIFTLGQKQVISGFEENILGMKVGKIKNFTLTPEKAYGEYDSRLLLKNVKRNIDMKRNIIVTTAQYKAAFNKDPVLNEVLNPEKALWEVKVVKFNQTHVTLENLLPLGSSVQLPELPWESTVVNVTSDIITIKQNPKVGDPVQNLASTGSSQLSGIVIRVDDISFDVDANHPFAGKTLTFEVKIIDIQKA
jgi:FKBP-type peptidyl-prolyl cis-trans isomerase 2